MQNLFKAVRESCSALTWSRGVELSRGGNVVALSLTDSEAIVRVATPGKPVSATVKLWPEDEDWVCDCRSSPGACEHAAAAIIALKRAKDEGKPLPLSKFTLGLVAYAFNRSGESLVLERKIRAGEKETPVANSLLPYLSNEAGEPIVGAGKEDLSIDSLLKGARAGPLPTELLRSVLHYLTDNKHVTLDGKKVGVGKPASQLQGVIVDGPDGVRLFFEPAPEIREVFGKGAALIGETLHPLETPESLPEGRVYTPHEMPSLVCDLLPKLRERFPVFVQSQKLPEVDSDAMPRLVFNTSAQGEVLSVIPLIVYGEPPFARVDGGKLVCLEDTKKVPLRNESLENRLAMSLRSEFGLSVGRKIEFRGEAAIQFADSMEKSRFSVLGNGIGYFGIKPALIPEVSFREEALQLRFSAPGGKGSVSAPRVFQAWRDGLARVPLEGGEGWAPVPTEWLERYGHRVLALLEAKDADGALPKFARPEVARLCEDLDIPCPPDFSRLRQQLENFTKMPVAKLPGELRATLRGYQQRGVDWLSFLRQSGLGALLADDMGLGKTLQTICVLSGRALVVAPTSVLPNWQKELARFRPSLGVSVYHGGERRLDPKADVTLTTYAILRLDKEVLAEPEWDLAVLDEAQNIKNPQSQVAQAAFGLKAKFRMALTGTPIENRLEDLWSLFHFLNSGLLGGHGDFRVRYANPKDLRAKIKPFILRRLKQEVAPELPPRTDIVLYCELDPSEQVTYETVRAATRKDVLESLGVQKNVMAALESLLRLRQAACHPALLPGETATDSSKVRLLLEKLEEVVSEGHKALVFSQWTSFLDLIEPHLRRQGLRFCRIDGTTRDRASVVEQFQGEAGPPLMLMTLKSGGVGLNLTAADYVFLVDPWWNPAAEDQAADRAHRIGQTRPVFVHRLVTKGTVEEKILALQESKRAAAAGALSGAESAVGLTREDLLELLS